VTQRLQHALESLYGLERRRDKLGLEGTRALLAALGDPQRRFRSVHVAGTNGKGSVCAIIERVLREAGYRTGLFTSPHLVEFRERIRVGGRWADEAWLERTLGRIQALPAGQERTFFEVCTALAFDYFAAREVEWAVVEVGLGGRLDCTNVLAPEVSVITSIGLDHTEILGDTLEQIAAEKAGIVKPGVPVVCGAAEEPIVELIRGIADRRGAPFVRAAPGLAGNGRAEPTLDPGLARSTPRSNIVTALATLAALSERGVALPRAAFQAGLARARWPGRFEPCPAEPRLWWDGAHNPDGARALAAACRAAGLEPGVLVVALSRDKDAAAMLAELAALSPRPPLIATRSRSERALPPDKLAAAARRAGFGAETAPDVAAACRRALARASRESPVLLTGSLFAVGEAMECFGGAPGEWL